jgi:hypothetical protein
LKIRSLTCWTASARGQGLGLEQVGNGNKSKYFRIGKLGSEKKLLLPLLSG